VPNGKPGDHPLTDIVVHGREVYSPEASRLVREIVKLADDETRRALSKLLFLDFNERSGPDVARLERTLAELHERLLREARARGRDA
jgi:hypothetical protein